MMDQLVYAVISSCVLGFALGVAVTTVASFYFIDKLSRGWSKVTKESNALWADTSRLSSNTTANLIDTLRRIVILAEARAVVDRDVKPEEIISIVEQPLKIKEQRDATI